MKKKERENVKKWKTKKVDFKTVEGKTEKWQR